jgi:hypothetical protein
MPAATNPADQRGRSNRSRSTAAVSEAEKLLVHTFLRGPQAPTGLRGKYVRFGWLKLIRLA